MASILEKLIIDFKIPIKAIEDFLKTNQLKTHPAGKTAKILFMGTWVFSFVCLFLFLTTRNTKKQVQVRTVLSVTTS